ncbi:multinuclear nonheme iron-dependent oxidase [Staphylococcus equorum]|uniref:multinuclear nonheme iron-dependent oxidase n=1 Tax=Staphylococcus equorum TaxID=246432 RepID=UPI002980D2BE|nr:DUF692 family multinuclear iron-containing protein [Staphylococcus equorum]MDW5470298.1 DUF692 family protein [Staphylococcus equorum]
MKVGLCYRENIHGKWIEDIIPHIDFLELMPDTLDIDTAIKLKNICIKNNIPIGIHTLKGSLGSLEGPNFNALKNYFYTHEYFESEYFSDHVAFSHINGQYLSSVFPIDYNEDNINTLSENLKCISPYFNKILIENITQNKLSPNYLLLERDFNVNSSYQTLQDIEKLRKISIF